MARGGAVVDVDGGRDARGSAFFSHLASERPDIVLCRASAKVLRAAEARASGQGVGVCAELVLKMLNTAGPSSQQELSEGLRIDRSVMVGCVDGLEDAGFVKRERDAQDRRRYAVTITDAGRGALAEMESGVPGFLDEAFGALSRSERDRLGQLLSKLLGVSPPPARRGSPG